MTRTSPSFAASSSGNTRYTLCNSSEAGYSELSTQTANRRGEACRVFMALIQIAFAFDFFSTDPVGFVPVQFSFAYAAIPEANHSDSLELAPMTRATLFAQSGTVSD